MIELVQIGNIIPQKGFENPQRGRVYWSGGIAPCLTTMGGGGQHPKYLVVRKRKTKRGVVRIPVNTAGGVAPCLLAHYAKIGQFDIVEARSMKSMGIMVLNEKKNISERGKE